MKLACLAATALLACSTTDDRPQTLAFITESILAPNCGTAECHSTKKHQSNDVFDNVAGAQASMATYGLLLCSANGSTLDPCVVDARKTYLYQVIDDKDIEGDQMPLDQPLATADLALIVDWINAGADGYTSPTASGN